MIPRDGAPPSPSSPAFPSDGLHYRSRSPSPDDTLHASRPYSPGPSETYQSPAASTFLRTAATLEGLAQQLSTLSNGTYDEAKVSCCCGAVEQGRACPMARDRERAAEKLLLSGGKTRSSAYVDNHADKSLEIGNALLHRYEALEKKHAGLQAQVRP
jgi:hypothetical protein